MTELSATAFTVATSWRATRVSLLLALLFIGVWFATVGERALFNPDEGRYAEIPLEMVLSGDWLTPRLNDLKYFEKPPLQYWMTALAYKAFGANEFSARLWCSLTGLAAVALVALLGTRLFNREVGWLSAALLAGSWMHIILGHVNTLDMGLSFFLNAAIGAFLLAQHSEARSRGERNWMLVAWTMAALALLSKGVVAIALPGLTLFVYSIVTRQWSVWRRLHWTPGIALFLAIGAPWFIAISLANPEFPQFFFLQEHAQRFLTQVHRRVEPWWYFLPLVIGGALPWATLAVPAMFRSWRANKSHTATSVDSLLFLTMWIVVIVAFFSLSQSKLAPYILPTMPALALVTGHYASRITADSLLPHLYGIACIYGLAILYLALAPIPERHGLAPETVINILEAGRVAFTIALTGAITGIVLAYREQVSAALLALCAGSFLCISTLLFATDEVKGIRSGHDLAAAIAPFVARDKPLYSLAQYDHSLTFYLQKPATVVGYRGELDFGLSQEPRKWLADEQAFKNAWAQDSPGTIALIPHEIYLRFASEHLPMLPIAGNSTVRAVMKPTKAQ